MFGKYLTGQLDRHWLAYKKYPLLQFMHELGELQELQEERQVKVTEDTPSS
jgi:hypothetical protein